MKKLEERREKKQAEVDRCADLRGMLYEDMKDGIISKEDYKELHTAYEQRKRVPRLPFTRLNWKWKMC